MSAKKKKKKDKKMFWKNSEAYEFKTLYFRQ